MDDKDAQAAWAWGLQGRVKELETKLRVTSEQLGRERDRSSRARKKLRQLLEKLRERDALIDRIARGGAGDLVAKHRAAGVDNGTAGLQSLPGEDDRGRFRRRPSTKEVAAHNNSVSQKREEIVRLLEGHLAEMRVNLLESQSELQELLEKKLAKEAEWTQQPEQERSKAKSQVHGHALSMLTEQVNEKRRFAADLNNKVAVLEEQITQQRSLMPSRGGPSRATSDGEALTTAELNGKDTDDDTKMMPRDEVPYETAGGSSPAFCRQATGDALTAFLEAAGPSAEVILERPALHAAFEAHPLQLSSDAIDDCSPEERALALSLFTAWASTAGNSLQMSDVALEVSDVLELKSTLETCGARLAEWDTSRCLASESTARALFQALATQPLRQLSLGYNALGAAGAAALVEAAGAWSHSLELLGLEMNGLGDSGCRALASALTRGVLPCLRSLELGWNELSGVSAPSLAGLLLRPADCTSAPISGPPCLRRLGLGGNKFADDGARPLILAALANPDRPLELDLSMNHIGSQPLTALCEWAEADGHAALQVSINLEWNVIDGVPLVQRLAEALSRSRLAKGRSPSGPREPLVRLGNNDELADLEPSAILSQSRGLIWC